MCNPNKKVDEQERKKTTAFHLIVWIDFVVSMFFVCAIKSVSFAATVWWIDFSCTGCSRSHETANAIWCFWCNALEVGEFWTGSHRISTLTGQRWHRHCITECWTLWWIWYGRCDGIRTSWSLCVWLTRWRTTNAWTARRTSTGRRS